MKTKEEIEYLAEEYAYIGREANLSNHTYNKTAQREFTLEKMGFINGYTQCQEDMADKNYTKEDIENTFNSGKGYGVPDNIKDFNSFINSLNKQD